jgi:hypothetical protein
VQLLIDSQHAANFFRHLVRSSLGWELDHVLGYFAITVLVCFAWSRPFAVGGTLIVFAALLELLQSFTPDRSPNFRAWDLRGWSLEELVATVDRDPVVHTGAAPVS